MLCIYLVTHHYYGHVVAIHYTYSYVYNELLAIELQINYYENLLSLKIRPFYEIFILQKFGAILPIWYLLYNYVAS